ncbi:MAG: lipid II:glycine glycyltransferase FemX [Nocardioides sp.]
MSRASHATPPSPVTVRSIPAAEHLAFVNGLASASFLQTPAWAAVKAGWRAESVGWFVDGHLAGVGLVLYRRLPRLARSFAYLPEGPVLSWDSDQVAGDLGRWLEPLVTHLRGAGAFGVRIGPPVVTRRWRAATIKEGIADPDIDRLDQLAPSEVSATGDRVTSGLRELGWRPVGSGPGFAAGQPRHVFQVPLRHQDGSPRTEAEVLAGMNQLWRRNIKKADKSGVSIASGTDPEWLADFHALYVETAARDHFTPRPRSYFETMLASLGAEDPDRIRLWMARHDGDLVAATIAIRVGRHAWYSYGASSTAKREVRGSNAVQWAMMCDALKAGADVYDLRGITATLDSTDPHVGLIGFKVGTGGEAVEYAGEWDLPLPGLLNRGLHTAFDLYLSRR